MGSFSDSDFFYYLSLTGQDSISKFYTVFISSCKKKVRQSKVNEAFHNNHSFLYPWFITILVFMPIMFIFSKEVIKFVKLFEAAWNILTDLFVINCLVNSEWYHSPNHSSLETRFLYQRVNQKNLWSKTFRDSVLTAGVHKLLAEINLPFSLHTPETYSDWYHSSNHVSLKPRFLYHMVNYVPSIYSD